MVAVSVQSIGLNVDFVICPFLLMHMLLLLLERNDWKSLTKCSRVILEQANHFGEHLLTFVNEFVVDKQRFLIGKALFPEGAIWTPTPSIKALCFK